jgi:hypothetical protein
MTEVNHLFNEIGNHTETLLSRHEKDLHQVMQNLNTDDDENLQKKFKIAMNHVVTVDHFDPLRASVETKITFIKEKVDDSVKYPVGEEQMELDFEGTEGGQDEG